MSFPSVIPLKAFTIYIEQLDGTAAIYEMDFPCDIYGKIPDAILKELIPFMSPTDDGPRFCKFLSRTRKLGNYLLKEITKKEAGELSRSKGK